MRQTNIIETDELQTLCHKLGRSEFLATIVEALYRVSDDTSDFDDKSISEDYQIAASAIQNLIDSGEI